MYAVFVIRVPDTPPETNGNIFDAGDPTYVALFPHPEISEAVVPEDSSNGQKPIG
jgi:hypothetical protein